jgi:hypothetical protein
VVESDIFENIHNYVLSVKTCSTFYLFKYFNLHTSVQTSTVIIKCEFCVKLEILESISACVILMCYKKKAKKFTEDGLNKRRKASELYLQSYYITNSVH